MPSEPQTNGAPPVPSVWRLAWLLFMQPITLHRMHQAWGLTGRPSLVRLWRLARERDPAVHTLMSRYALLLFGIMPLATALAVTGLILSGFSVQMPDMMFGVIAGLMLGVTISVALGSLFGLAFGLAFGVLDISVLDVERGAAYGVIGAVVAVVLGLANDVDRGVGKGKMSNLKLLAVTGVLVGVGNGVITGAMWSLTYADALMVGVASSVAIGVIDGALIRIPLWLPEALLTQWLAWRMRRRPDAAPQLSAWLPIRHDDLIYLPLPGLRACLIQVAEADPELGKELIALAAASPGQRRIAQRALVEIQARELERAARDKVFARAADLDLPFLPKEPELAAEPTNAPLRPFHAAARDLVAGGTNHRQRRLALERARGSLESLNVTVVGTVNPAPLAERLLPTAAVWLDAIREEEDRLAREEAVRPEVPAAFVAGPPLTPERAEDRTLFKGRADIIKLIAHDLSPDRRGVLLVVGQRRMGKTSLCNWLPTYLGTGTTVVISNFQPLSGDEHRETPHRRVLGDLAARAATDTPPPPSSPRWGEGLRWLQELDRTCTDRRILVVIDEVERVEDGIRAGWCSTDFLDFLRAAGDALRHIRFLLLAAYPLHRIGPHWTDRLVSVTSRTISYLDEQDARELLNHPIPEFPDVYPEGGVDLILEQTGRHPYLLQKAGDDLCRLLNSRGGLRRATPDELTEVFDGMIRDVQVFDELWRSRTGDEQASLRRIASSDEPADLDPAALQLAREGYLERRGDRAAFAVPLFREWIRTNII